MRAVEVLAVAAALLGVALQLVLWPGVRVLLLPLLLLQALHGDVVQAVRRLLSLLAVALHALLQVTGVLGLLGAQELVAALLLWLLLWAGVLEVGAVVQPQRSGAAQGPGGSA